MIGLSVKNVCYKYNTTVKQKETFSLLDITFCAAAGQISCIVGPSGCGKSTLLKIISGQLMAKSGDIYWDRYNISREKFGNRQTATVHQDHSLFLSLTVFDNIKLASQLSGVSSDNSIYELLDRLKLLRLANQRVEHLSGGERQRVAIARALSVRPKILLLDEPTASLDMLSTQNLIQFLDNVKDSNHNICILVVTHDRNFCLRIADTMIVMDEGELLWVGAPATLKKTECRPRVYEITGTALTLKCPFGDKKSDMLKIKMQSENCQNQNKFLTEQMFGNSDGSWIIQRKDIRITCEPGRKLSNDDNEIVICATVARQYLSEYGDICVDLSLGGNQYLNGLVVPYENGDYFPGRQVSLAIDKFILNKCKIN